MKIISRITIAFLLLMLMIGQAMAAGSKKKVVDRGITDQDKRKAEYIYMQAQVYKAQDSIASYYDLVKYAYELDSTNTAIAFYYGYLMVLKDNSTDLEKNRGLELMKRHVDAHPEDYYETSYFSDACMSLRHNDMGLQAIERLAEINPTKTEVQMRLAAAYVRNEKFAEALKVYEKIEDFEGKSVEITAYKAALCSQLGDTIGAITEMRNLYNTAPANVNFNLIMSELFKQYNMQDSAIYYLDQAQRLDPENGNVYFAKAQYYDEIGDSVNYDKQIYNALVSNDLPVETKLDVLTQYTQTQLIRNDSTDRVNNLFKVLIEQHPHEPKVHELYSMYYSTIKDYKHAIEEIGYEVDLDPTNAEAWQRLMVVNIMDDNYAGAIKAAEKALEYNPENLDLYRYIAPSYYQMKEYDKAIVTYDKALALVDSTKNVELYSDLLCGKGDVYVELGDSARGFEYYERSLSIAPGNTGTMNNYAYFLSLCGKDLDKAESMAAKAVYSNPNNSTFIDTYAWVFFKKKNYDMALLYIKSAIDNADSPSADILEHYGDILYMTGDKENAVTQWEKALELNPTKEVLQRKVLDKTYYEE
ncbi:MAG: tetratricopeptide repeat protein [Muribaculaceae bacterium]|nr:tetratricopeptide repeat protein [Muribaculaceae bacterium]MBQ6278830.1 tetratricopeptide repeat protein [Muribaculaceae bacterium]